MVSFDDSGPRSGPSNEPTVDRANSDNHSIASSKHNENMTTTIAARQTELTMSSSQSNSPDTDTTSVGKRKTFQKRLRKVLRIVFRMCKKAIKMPFKILRWLIKKSKDKESLAALIGSAILIGAGAALFMSI